MTAKSSERQMARYQCLTCDHLYQHYAHPTRCPMCNGLQVKWLNWTEKTRWIRNPRLDHPNDTQEY